MTTPLPELPELPPHDVRKERIPGSLNGHYFRVCHKGTYDPIVIGITGKTRELARQYTREALAEVLRAPAEQAGASLIYRDDTQPGGPVRLTRVDKPATPPAPDASTIIYRGWLPYHEAECRWDHRCGEIQEEPTASLVDGWKWKRVAIVPLFTKPAPDAGPDIASMHNPVSDCCGASLWADPKIPICAACRQSATFYDGGADQPEPAREGPTPVMDALIERKATTFMDSGAYRRKLEVTGKQLEQRAEAAERDRDTAKAAAGIAAAHVVATRKKLEAAERRAGDAAELIDLWFAEVKRLQQIADVQGLSRLTADHAERASTAAAIYEHCAKKLKEALAAKEGGVTDSQRLDWLQSNSCDLVCFEMPTGQGDADIGWRIIEHHMAKPKERTIGEVFRDDARAAIDAAMTPPTAPSDEPA